MLYCPKGRNIRLPSVSMCKLGAIVGTLAAGLVCCWAQVTGTPGALTPGEVRASRAFDAAKKLGPPELYAFLKPMPKGAELHYHLSGGIYAETFLADAVKQGLCIDPVAARFAQPGPGMMHAQTEPCGPGTEPASEAIKDQKLYDRLVDALSMRSFVPSAGVSGHDQFFSGNRVNGPTGFMGGWLAEVATRAADQN